MRVAILRPGALGDVVAVRAVAGFLRAMAPQAKIILFAAAGRGALLAKCGVVHEAFDLDSSDAAWLFGGGGPPPLRLAQAFAGCEQAFVYFEDSDGEARNRLRALGCRDAYFHRSRPAEDESVHIHEHLLIPLRAVFGASPPGAYRPLSLRVPQAQIDAALTKWHLLNQRYAVIHPGSGSKQKNWPLPHFVELGAHLAKSNYSLAITSGEADDDLGERLQAGIKAQSRSAPLLVRTDLFEVAAILAKAALYIGNDSGISHLAAAVEAEENQCGSEPPTGAAPRQRRPCIVIFGPTSPCIWAPPEATAVVAPAGQLEALPAAEVIAACEKALAGQSSRTDAPAAQPASGLPRFRKTTNSRVPAVDIALQEKTPRSFYGKGLIDSHCHLQDKRLRRDLNEVIARAANAGVRVLISNTVQAEEWNIAKTLAGKNIVIFLGIHPWHADKQPSDWQEQLQSLAAAGDIGIGEIGLDKLKNLCDSETQEAAFAFQWKLAQRHGLPVAVHCVRAWDRLWTMVSAMKPVNAWMIHAFGGSVDWLSKFAAKGAWFSFGGSITYERNKKIREAASAAPLDRLLLESDAPDFLPQQARATGHMVNEPSCLGEVAATLAAIRRMPVQELTDVLWENSRRFLGHLWPSGIAKRI